MRTWLRSLSMTSLSMAPGESARQFAAAQAAAIRRAFSAEEPADNANAKPASAASPQPTVDFGVSGTAGVKKSAAASGACSDDQFCVEIVWGADGEAAGENHGSGFLAPFEQFVAG